jgi:N-acetylglucosamine-6-phosphate deacetylase
VSGGVPLGDRDVRVADGRIAAVDLSLDASTGPVVDATGLVVAPGLIDLHIHGAGGHDTLDATSTALAAIGRHLATGGVTSWAPTTASHSRAAIDAVLAAHASHRRAPDEARSVGIHLEGPYLSEARCGAQDPAHLRDADETEWSDWLASGQVSEVTLAPERDPGHRLLRAAVDQGVRVALGHCEPGYAEASRAIDSGATQATHLFNGMPPLHHREPGVVGACLNDPRVRVQLIADNIHLHPGILRLVHAAVGRNRVLLVSDAMRATGLGDGDYLLAEQRVHVRDGVARTDAGGLAGSTLELRTAVANLVSATGCSLAEALHAASGVPAAELGLHTRGAFEVGLDADLVLLDPADLQVQLTVIRGVVAHDALPDERWIRR